MRRLGTLLPLLGLAAAAVLVVVLALKVRELNERYARLYERIRYPYAGMWVPTFRAATLAGDSVTIGETPEGRRQVLFFFTTTCPYCKSTLPAWKELTATLDTLSAPQVEVYGVSLDSVGATREYAVEHELPYPVLFFPRRSSPGSTAPERCRSPRCWTRRDGWCTRGSGRSPSAPPSTRWSPW